MAPSFSFCVAKVGIIFELQNIFDEKLQFFLGLRFYSTFSLRFCFKSNSVRFSKHSCRVALRQYLRQKRVIIDFAQTKRAIDISGLYGALYLCSDGYFCK